MNLILLFDHRFYRDDQGVIFSSQNYNYELFANRYLAVFDSMRIVARVSPDPPRSRGDACATGPGVEIMPVGNWHGPFEFLRRRSAVRRIVKSALVDRAAICMIVPGTIASLAHSWLQDSAHPYGVEVVGDPYDVFAAGAIRHPLRPVFRVLGVRNLRQHCMGASAAAYVTESALQRRYPPNPNAFATYYSSIELTDAAFVSKPRVVAKKTGPFRLVMVGTLAQLYKAPDVLIDAVALCKQRGMTLQLDLIGSGKYQPTLEQQVRRLDLQKEVHFWGQLPAGEPIRAHLDQADLFVLPSRQEGVPRAMIEAMARGLPCVGTTIGGIPELLPPEDLVAANDVMVLADKISEVLNDPARMMLMSERNLTKARQYHSSILQRRRGAMYTHLCSVTEAWYAERCLSI